MELSNEELLNNLQNVDEYEFEKLIADLWEKRGWNTTRTTGSRDNGIDVIAEKNAPFYQKQLIQAKRWATKKVGSPKIQQYSSLKQQMSDVDTVIVVTTSSFTSQARKTAEQLNVKLIDGETLLSIIEECDFKPVLKGYFRNSESVELVNKSGIFDNTEIRNKINKIKEIAEENEDTIPEKTTAGTILIDSTSSGYRIGHGNLFKSNPNIRNVHHLKNTTGQVQSFDADDWLKLESIANQNNMQVLDADEVSIMIGESERGIVDTKRTMKIMDEILTKIFSVELDDVHLVIQEQE